MGKPTMLILHSPRLRFAWLFFVLLCAVACILFALAGYQFLPFHLRNLNFKPLTTDGLYGWPRWSPDGARIAFDSLESGLYHVLVVKSDGGQPTRITNSQVDARSPDWSPDGKRIAFASYTGDQSQIYTMNQDGTNIRQITNTSNRALSPKWSPDGKHIAFTMRTRLSGYDSELYMMDEDGGNIIQLTHYPLGGIEEYEWSPDGSAIAFGAERLDKIDQGAELGEYGPFLYVMNADGSGLRQIDLGGSATLYPTWSPEGKQILVDVHYVPTKMPANMPKSGFYLIESDGSNRRLVFRDACRQPNWSASRNQIVLVCGDRLMEGYGYLYVVDAMSIVH